MLYRILGAGILIFILSISSYAKDESLGAIKAFYSKLSKQERKKIENLSESDEYYRMGYSYLTNKKDMSKKRVNNFYDKNKKSEIILLPNYLKAAIEFEKSVKKYKNPSSAYLGLYSMNFLLEKNKIKAVKRRKLFIETLYKQANTCEGYIQYADMLMKGNGVKRDLQKGIDILDNARKNCWNRANDWEKSIIDVKQTQARYKIKLLKDKKKQK